MKVNIIGGGMSGLTLGCYLQMYGFETEIFEKNAVPGGLCASWKRGEYTFDGSIRWILGSGKGNAFYKLWSELIDMDELDFITHETCLEIELNNNRNKYGEKVFKLYTNIDRLKAYLLDIAPEDEKQIRKFIFLLRVLQRYELPPMICEISHLQNMRQKSKMISYLPLGHTFLRWGRATNFEFARKLKIHFSRKLLNCSMMEKRLIFLLWQCHWLHMILRVPAILSGDRQGLLIDLGKDMKVWEV
ncbi:MAG TPA: NAD(P)-binding protein [Bacteroidales bacterium]|nr:NAD(P)-binding protein [Bacteroidales bacterium]